MSHFFVVRDLDGRPLCMSTATHVIVHKQKPNTQDTDNMFARDESSDEDDSASVSSSASDSGDEDQCKSQRRTFSAATCRRCGNKRSMNPDFTSNLTSDRACMPDKQGFVNQTLARHNINNTPSSNNVSIIQLNNLMTPPKNEFVKQQDLLPQDARTPRTTYAPKRNLGAVAFDESNMPGDDEVAKRSAEVAKRSAEVAKRSAEVAKEQDTLERLSRDLADAKAECVEQKGTIERLKSNLAAKSTGRNDLAAELDAFYAQEPDARTTRDPMLQKALATIETAHDHNAAPNLEYKLDAANNRIAMLEAKVREYKDMELDMELKMQKEKTRERSELELMQNKLGEDLDAAKEEIVNLRKKVEDYDDMQKALAAAMQKESLLRQEVEDLRKVAIPKHDHEELRKKAGDHEALREAITQAQGDFISCKEELEKTKTKLQEREDDLKILRETLKKEQDNAAMLQDTLATVRADVTKDPSKKKGGFLGRFKR